MTHRMISRRRLLAAAAGVGLGLAASSVIRADDLKPAPEEPFPKDAKEALQRLVAGNKRFVAGESIHPRATKEWRQRLTKGQKPFAAVLAAATRASPRSWSSTRGSATCSSSASPATSSPPTAWAPWSTPGCT